MTLLILAAGMGSRYGGLKQIDPIGPSGEFIVDYSIYDAIQAGFDKVVFVIKEDNLELFRETIGKRIEKHIRVEYVFQKIENIPKGHTIPEGRIKPWGTGHAVLEAADAIKDCFVVINSDDFYGRDTFSKLGNFLKSNTNQDSISHFSMAGFVLKNTVTENGHVSRGVCEIDDNGFLTRVTERTKIQRNGNEIQYFENDFWTTLSEDSIVSMNCWAFTPEIFTNLKTLFKSFFENAENKDMLKAEFYLPFAVQDMISRGICDVRVIPTTSKWYGVTYREDRPSVINAIKEMTDKGIYPEKLW